MVGALNRVNMNIMYRKCARNHVELGKRGVVWFLIFTNIQQQLLTMCVHDSNRTNARAPFTISIQVSK